MLKLHELFLTFLYSGKVPKAPGTFGSLVALAAWFYVTLFFCDHQATLLAQNIFWGVFLIIAFVYGCVATPLYTKQFGQVDHQTIVLDEVVGQILALQFTFAFFYENYFSHLGLVVAHLIFCFASFRFFDIKKPLFIGYVDRNFKNGFGVMFDDLLCGIVTALLGLIFLDPVLNLYLQRP